MMLCFEPARNPTMSKEVIAVEKAATCAFLELTFAHTTPAIMYIRTKNIFSSNHVCESGFKPPMKSIPTADKSNKVSALWLAINIPLWEAKVPLLKRETDRVKNNNILSTTNKTCVCLNAMYSIFLLLLIWKTC
jgi:hypothetical protein